MSAPLVSIIGPPAVGKTTLASNLCRELPARLIVEDFAGNPFLEASYAGDAQAQLPGQIYFLMSRVAQLSLASWPDDGICVSDYGFCQDRIFAQLRLSKDDFRLYERLAVRVAGLVCPPRVVVHLDCDEGELLRRIAARGRAFEKAMTSDFLSAMRRAYRVAAAELSCPVIDVPCDRVDLRERASRQELLREIRSALPT